MLKEKLSGYINGFKVPESVQRAIAEIAFKKSRKQQEIVPLACRRLINDYYNNVPISDEEFN